MGALHGSPRAIGMFALYLNDCIYSDNIPNLPLRDNNHWLHIAQDIYKKSLRENKDKINDEKEKIDNFEKKEKTYDFNKTVGFESKKINNKNDFNFGLLSSQLPSSLPNQPLLPNSSIRFLSSLPLPPPIPPLSLNRSLATSNSYLLSTAFASNISSEDLTSHIALWAELSATYKKPYIPNVCIEWSTFIAKLECLLFQIISVQFPPIHLPLNNNTEANNRNSSEKKSNINRISHNDENNRYNRDINQLKNSFHRTFSMDDKLFLKQKFTPESVSKCNNHDATSSSELQKKDVLKEDKHDSKSTISLPAYRIFLTWWLPLLFTLRNIKNEFCCIYHSSVPAVPRCFKAVPIVNGFIGRAGAIELLKTGPFRLFF
jgi:hypothetical protein